MTNALAARLLGILEGTEKLNYLTDRLGDEIAQLRGKRASFALVGQSVRSESVWLTKELPALRGNPAVTKITIIDPATLVEKVIFQR
jgi:hypothetical protein